MEEKLKILRLLKAKLIDNFGDNIVNVILFGSQAKGTARDDSDYDILIVVRDDYDWRYKSKIRYVCYDIAIEFEILFDTIIISLEELNNSLRGKQPIIANTIEKGIYV